MHTYIHTYIHTYKLALTHKAVDNASDGSHSVFPFAQSSPQTCLPTRGDITIRIIRCHRRNVCMLYTYVKYILYVLFICMNRLLPAWLRTWLTSWCDLLYCPFFSASFAARHPISICYHSIVFQGRLTCPYVQRTRYLDIASAWTRSVDVRYQT